MKLKVTHCNTAAILLVCQDLPESEQGVVAAINGTPFDADSAARQAINYHGPTWCGAEGGTPLVVGGFIPLRQGVYRAWFYATNAAWERHGRDVSRIVRDLIASMLVEQAHRIEVVTLADRSHARRWYETLGLRLEAVMPQYGAGREDAVMYVATRQEAS